MRLFIKQEIVQGVTHPGSMMEHLCNKEFFSENLIWSRDQLVGYVPVYHANLLTYCVVDGAGLAQSALVEKHDDGKLASPGCVSLAYTDTPGYTTLGESTLGDVITASSHASLDALEDRYTEQGVTDYSEQLKDVFSQGTTWTYNGTHAYGTAESDAIVFITVLTRNAVVESVTSDDDYYTLVPINSYLELPAEQREPMTEYIIGGLLQQSAMEQLAERAVSEVDPEF